jgi:hypothetical protein
VCLTGAVGGGCNLWCFGAAIVSSIVTVSEDWEGAMLILAWLPRAEVALGPTSAPPPKL